MNQVRLRNSVLLACSGVLLCASAPVWGQSPGALGRSQQASVPAARDLFVTVGKSLVVESPVNIQRISVGDSTKAEALAVSPRELLINGKAAGETSLVVWQQGGNRIVFDLRVQPPVNFKLDAVRQELQKELPGEDVSVAFSEGSVYLRGTVKDMASADRAVAIAATLGKVVNLLRVKVPAVQDQILLKVKFAEIDRTVEQDLGANLFSLGAGHTPGTVSTGQFPAPTVQTQGGVNTATITDFLNIFLFRPDLNLGATIEALASRGLTQILAEPNILAINGKEASFLAGGEIPVPVVENALGGGAVSVLWKEFGVKLSFLPTVTPRNTIHLKVTPEVSTLDKADGVSLSGFSIPAFSTRKMQTEVELENGQTFGIAGLLDNRTQDTLSKIPGIGDIPILGKLFQSRARTKSNTELLVLVTPELVRPIPAGQPTPGLQYPMPFLNQGAAAPRTPGVGTTGPVPLTSAVESVPYEQLVPKQSQQPAVPGIQLLTVPMAPPAQVSTDQGVLQNAPQPNK